MDNQTLSRILDLNHHLAQGKSLKAFFDTAAETAQALTNAEYSAILGYDENANSLFVISAPWLPPHAASSLRLPLNQSAAGWIFQYEQTLNLDDAPSQRPGFIEIQQLTPKPVKSLMGVPIIFQNRALGVLEIMRADEPFGYDDLAVLEHIATIAAGALSHVRMQAELNRLNREIARLDDLKSNFIAIVSHELRTPLGLILGHATFLREIIPESFQEQMDVVVRNAVRLKELIDGMSKVNNYQSGTAHVKEGTLSIKTMLLELAEAYMPQAREKHILIKTALPEDDLLFYGDADKIRTALEEVIRNGILFNRENGVLHISAQRTPGYIRITFKDTGIGIPKEELSHIFDRFYQVESHLTRHHEGIGLGLSVAKAMIELHGGRIWAESTPGQGSTFTIILPSHTLPRAAQTSPIT